MNASTVVLAALVVTVLAWAGLTTWNRLAHDRLDRMKPKVAAAMQAYNDSYTAQGELPPPSYYSFRQNRVVEFAPGVAQTVHSEDADPDAPFAVATVVDADAPSEWPPVWMWGMWGGSYLVQGAFAALSLGLLATWLRLRAG